MLRKTLVVLAVAVGATALISPAQAKFNGLTGEVGPGFTVEVKKANGKDLTTIKAGTYLPDQGRGQVLRCTTST